MAIHPDTDGRCSSYICDKCGDEVRILASDGDREDLDGWVEVHNAQTGELERVICYFCLIATPIDPR